MSKIYIVTSGIHGRYHIVAATTNKDIANAICKTYEHDDYTDRALVEEYDDYEDATIIEKSAEYQYVEYKIFIDTNNNIKQIIFQGFTDKFEEARLLHDVKTDLSMWIKCTLKGDGDSDESREEAKKIAEDFRTQFLLQKFRIRL
jgi:hypothetical protein